MEASVAAFPLGRKNVLRDSRGNVAVLDFYDVSAPASESNIHSFICITLGACLITMITQKNQLRLMLVVVINKSAILGKWVRNE